MRDPTIVVTAPPATPAALPWSGRLPVVGIGLDGLAGMSPRGRRLIDAAAAVVGSARQLELIEIGSDKTALAWNGRLADLLEQLRGLSGDTAVLLASGDPNVYG